MPGGPTTDFATARVSARLLRHALSGAPRILLKGTRRRFLFMTAALALSLASVSGATAGSLEWSPNGVTPGGGGTGTWKTSTALWFNGITFQNWSNAALDDAVFGGTAGTVTLGAAITAHDLIFNVTGYTVTGNTLTLGGVTPTISVVSGGSATIDSAVAGTAGLTETGGGTLILTRNDNYTGGTTISAGTLQLGDGGTRGSIQGDVLNDGVLAIDRSNTLNYDGVVSGSGALTKTGAGRLTLSGDSTYTGGTTINAGTLRLGDNGTTGSIVGNVVDNATLEFNRNDDLTFGGIVSGTGALTKNRSNTLTLTGDNTYTGGTTISSGGALQLGNGSTTGSVIGNIANSGTLIFNRSDDLTFGGIVSGNGALTKSANNTLTLTGDNTFTGDTTISAGTLQLGAGGTTGSVARNIVDEGALVFNHSDDLTYSRVISGNGTVVQAGSGTLILTGNNIYNGITTISSGTLQLGDATNAGSVTGDIVDNAALVFNRSNTQTYTGSVSGSGTLTKIGTNTLTLTGDNTYTGITTISAGTLQIGNGATGSIAGDIIDNSALTFNRTGTLSYGGVISGSGSVTKSGTGTLTLTGSNTYSGATTISTNGSTLRAGAENAFSSASAYTLVNSSFLDLFGFDQTISSLAGTGTVTNSGGAAATLTTGGGNTNTLYSGDIQNGVGVTGLTKVGTGTFTLSGNNTYTGKTTVSAGTLQAGATNAFTPSSAFTVASGAILGLNNFNETIGSLAGAGTVTNGGAATRTLTTGSDGTSTAFSGVIQNGAAGSINLTKAGAGTFTLSGDNTYTGTTTISAGALQIGNGGTTGSVAGLSIIDSSALVFNRANALSYGGVISGVGTVTQAGTGTTTLTGANTYTGATTISAGALQIGNGGATGSIAGLSIVDNGALVFNRTGVAVTYGGVVSGTGTLTQAGTNTLTLSGSNTYTGATTVSAGTLQAGATNALAQTSAYTVASGAILALNNFDEIIGSLAGAGTVTNGGAAARTLTTGGDATSTAFSGVIQNGAAGLTNLTKAGAGTFTLSGDNTYTGTTTIGAGTLQIGNGGTTGSIAGNIVDNGALVFSHSNAQAYAGVVSGSGTLTKNGSNTLTLTGNNTYAGATTITAGTLQIGSGGTSGSIQGDVLDNGALVFNRSDDATYGGVISGAGSLTKIGTNTLTLTGDNTYGGATTITAGTLQLGNGGTSGSIVGNVIDNGVFAINRSDTVTFGGVISGAGTLTKSGAGTLILTGENTFGGGTTINAGTLQIGNGGTTGSISGNMIDNGVFVFDRSDALTYAGNISGTGSLVKNGAGTLTLTGVNPYSGGTTINAGKLLLADAVVPAPVVALPAAFLGGNGIIGPATIAGTLAPGFSIGTITVSGNMTFAAPGVYVVEISPTAADRTDVTGAATLAGGTVQVEAATGTYTPGATYTILHADAGVTGTFAGLTSDFVSIFLAPALSYNANNVLLTIARNGVSFASVGETPNEIATGGAVETLGFGNVIYDAVLSLTADQARHAFDALSGEVHASLSGVLVNQGLYVREAMLGRLIQASYGSNGAGPAVALAAGGPTSVSAFDNGTRMALGAGLDAGAKPDYGHGLTFWTRGFGSWGQFDGNGNAATAQRTLGGFVSGMDAGVGDGWRAGLATGYIQSDINVKARASSADVNSYLLAGYAGGRIGPVALRSGAAWTWHSIDTLRAVSFPGFYESESANYGGDTGQLFTELAYPIVTDQFSAVEPFAGIAYEHVGTDAFTESGPTAALTTPGSEQNVGYSTLGVRAATTIPVAGMLVTPRASVAWQYAFGELTPELALAFASSGIPFGISGVPLVRNSALIEAGLDLALGPDAMLGVLIPANSPATFRTTACRDASPGGSEAPLREPLQLGCARGWGVRNWPVSEYPVGR